MQPVDICNMALSEMGARVKITNLATDTTPAAVHCNIWYERLRRQMLRSAPWGFCRRTIQLTPTGSITDTPPDNQYPYLFNYAYPPDALKIRYVLQSPPPVPAVNLPNPGQPLMWSPWMMPRRDWRYIISDVGEERTILTNVQYAIAVYNGDITDVDNFDELFINALSAALAEKLIMPLSGNVQMKPQFMQLAMLAITQARAADGNEAIPKADHVPDWIRARGIATEVSFLGAGTMWGTWYCDWSSGGYGD